MEDFIILAFALLIGHVTHTLKKVKELRHTDTAITFKSYLKNSPYKTLFSLLSSLSVGLIAYDTDQLSITNAVLIGYFADSILDGIPKNFLTKKM